MTGQNEQHTFIGLDGVPLVFISVEVRSATFRCHLHPLLSGVIYTELCQGTLVSILMECC